MPTSNTVSVDSLQQVRILVVEDYPDNRDLILFMLNTLGYKADSVTNGREAVERLSEQEYDLVLMDCQMPELDGYQATKIIRQQKRHTTIVGLTAHAMQGDRQKCLDAGMNDYLTKPIDLKDLEMTIQKWCLARS